MNLFRKNETDHESDSNIDMDQEFKIVLLPLSAFQNNIKITMQIYHKQISFRKFY